MRIMKYGLLILFVVLVSSGVQADDPAAFRISTGGQMACVSSTPGHIASRGTIWCNSSDSNKLYYTTPGGSAAAVGGGGGPSRKIGYSIVDATNTIGTPVNQAGDITAGNLLQFHDAITATGARLYWAGTGNETVTVKLWNPSNTSVASGTVVTSGAGVYSVTFGSPYTVNSADIYKFFALTMYDGTHYTYVTTVTVPLPAATYGPISGGLYHTVNDLYVYASGNAFPSTSGGSPYMIPIEPIFTVP